MLDGILCIGGVGEVVYRAVRAAEYKFYQNEVIWVCDRRGKVVFT